MGGERGRRRVVVVVDDEPGMIVASSACWAGHGMAIWPWASRMPPQGTRHYRLLLSPARGGGMMVSGGRYPYLHCIGYLLRVYKWGVVHESSPSIIPFFWC